MVIGVILVYTATNGQWTFENAAARVVQTISGVFMIAVGAYLFAWGVSDRAGEAAGNFLAYIFDRFLKAFDE